MSETPVKNRSKSFSRWLNKGSNRSVVGVYAVLLIMILGARFISGAFTPLSLSKTIVELSTFCIVVAAGQFIVILVGGLDISVPGVMTFSAVLLTALSMGSNQKAVWVIPVVLLFGLAVGAVNGLGVVYGEVTPVVMTLAMNVILGGAVLVYTDGTPKGRSPEILETLTKESVAGIPLIALFLIVFVAATTLLFSRTIWGREIYHVGSNAVVAFLSGIPANRRIIGAYSISGGMAALGGMLLTGYSGQSYLTLGDPYLLLSVAAVILGGVSITGGKGSYVGVVGGALVLVTIGILLAGTSLPQSLRQIVYALVIIAAVLLSRTSDQRT